MTSRMALQAFTSAVFDAAQEQRLPPSTIMATLLTIVCCVNTRSSAPLDPLTLGAALMETARKHAEVSGHVFVPSAEA
jgi:hypothetical protein